ncbi:hypothetical protein ACLEPN_16985 [Myxococcus sp. 1LA]
MRGGSASDQRYFDQRYEVRAVSRSQAYPTQSTTRIGFRPVRTVPYAPSRWLPPGGKVPLVAA